MRVLCWNVYGNGGRDYDFPGLLTAWGADVAIFLEPPEWMRRGGTEERALLHRPVRLQPPVPSNWRLIGCTDGHYQGNAFVAYRVGTAVAIRSVQVPGTAQDNRLMLITVTTLAETRHIASCHAPFAANSGEARQYITNAMRMIARDGIDRVLNLPDLWLGDFNTYGNVAPQGADPNYVLALAHPTSGFGPRAPAEHYPLDKILSKATVPLVQCGRITPGSVMPMRGDIPHLAWDRDGDVPSDHLPIYADIGVPGPGAVLFVPPGLPPDEEDANPRRFRFEDPEPKRQRRNRPEDEDG
jgi:endonuclease/exonuclease/phosphatase family metal-dependent hydrolase